MKPWLDLYIVKYYESESNVLGFATLVVGEEKLLLEFVVEKSGEGLEIKMLPLRNPSSRMRLLRDAVFESWDLFERYVLMMFKICRY